MTLTPAVPPGKATRPPRRSGSLDVSGIRATTSFVVTVTPMPESTVQAATNTLRGTCTKG
ncbi:MAG: hypothetical protein ACLQVI_22830 [Polyangiaceae bacterium]